MLGWDGSVRWAVRAGSLGLAGLGWAGCLICLSGLADWAGWLSWAVLAGWLARRDGTWWLGWAGLGWATDSWAALARWARLAGLVWAGQFCSN